jgi:tetratricopeptide (TPR) repeat protein
VSVFRGGFTRAAAEAVAGASLGSLAALVNKSLLQRDPDSGRYDVHELVRQFAEHQLQLDAALHGRTRDRYVDHYSRFLEQRRAEGGVARRRRVLRELEAERGNLRWSWQLMLEERRLDAIDRCIDALVSFNEARSSRREAEAQLAAVLERFGPVTAEASAQLRRVAGVAASACASACDDQDRTQEAGQLLTLALELLDAAAHPRERAFALVQRGATQVEEALSQRIAWIEAAVQLYRTLGERSALGWALYRLGMVYYSGLGGLSQAVACLRESIAVQEAAAGPAEVRPLTLVRLGSFLIRQGEPAEGYPLIQRGVLLAREQQEDGLAGCLQILAMVERERGEYAAGEAAAREALALMSEHGRRVTWALITLGDLLAEQGRLDEAEAQYQVCLREHSGDIFAAHTARWCLGEVALARGQLGEARRLAEEALAGFERMGVGWGCVQALDTLAEAARQSGDLAGARRHFARACQVGLSAETHDVLLGVAAGIARVFAEAGDHGEALQLLRVIEGQPAIPARVRVRLQPLRTLLGASTSDPSRRKDATELRAALEHCVQRLR